MTSREQQPDHQQGPDLLDETSRSPSKSSILWSAICRDDTLLVEADAGGPAVYDDVHEASRLLLQKRPTPGWEHVTFGRRNGLTKLKGMKFHVYEHTGLGGSGVGQNQFGRDEEEGVRRRRFLLAEQQRKSAADLRHQAVMEEMDSVMALNPGGLTMWVFACVYDPSLVEPIQVQSFLERLITETAVFRQPTVPDADADGGPDGPSTTNVRRSLATPLEDLWRYGSDHALQAGFAHTLVQRMDEVSYLGKLALCHKRLDSLKNVMARNIDLLLERNERLERMNNEKAAQLNEMAKVFAKRSKQVKRQMMWNNARYGAILGGAITVGIAAAAVPIIIIF